MQHKNNEHRSLLIMQTKKDNIRNIILASAKDLFLEKGYNNVTMRSIAHLAQIQVSNIYNYYKNKDDLFKAVVLPGIQGMMCMLNEHNDEKNMTRDVFTNRDFQKEMFHDIYHLVTNYRDQLYLLFYQSAGSSYFDYKNTLINIQTQVSADYFIIMKEKYPELTTTFSHFFIHTMCAWWITIIEEIISHHRITPEEIEQFISEYIRFATAGWKELMNA